MPRIKFNDIKIINMNIHLPLLSILSAGILLAPAASGSLVLHYKLNEGSGTTVADSGAGTAANGVFFGSGSSWTTDTPSGSGYAFSVNDNSGSSYITAGTVPKIQGLGDFTISFWMKLSEVHANDRIFSTQSSVSSNGYLDLSTTDTNASAMTLNFKFSNGSSSATVISDAFDATEWVYISIVRTVTGNVDIYKGDASADSSLSLIASVTGRSTSPSINQNSGEFRFGSTAATTSNRTPDGFLSDFRLYTGTLTPTELNNIRLAAIPEPSAFVLLGGAALLFMARKRFV